MTVKISKSKPPIFLTLVAKFGINWNKGVIITYGDTVYCKYKIDRYKLAHEKTHIKQQLEYGVREWWDKYLEDPEFRKSQEIEAYKAEIEAINLNERNFTLRAGRIKAICQDFTSYMYGSIVKPHEVEKLLGLI